MKNKFADILKFSSNNKDKIEKKTVCISRNYFFFWLRMKKKHGRSENGVSYFLK